MYKILNYSAGYWVTTAKTLTEAINKIDSLKTKSEDVYSVIINGKSVYTL